MITLGGVTSLALYQYLDKIKYLENQIRVFASSLANIILKFLMTLTGILVIVLSIAILLIIIAILKFIKNKIKAKLRKKSTINYYKNQTREILVQYADGKIEPKRFIRKMTLLLESISYFSELNFEKNLVSKELFKAEKENILSKHNEDIKLLNLRKAVLLEEIEDQKRAIKNDGEWERKDILKRLDTKNHLVYERKRITKRQCKILLEEGYTQVNEYCVSENKIITVLVRPIGNHSITHTFLVWSTKKLFKKLRITDIKERLTVDADLIFEFNKKKYAIEVECGSLIGKYDQMNGKVGDLNKKYPNRWIFLVSNRDLLKKYKKFGASATRANIKPKLVKMLKIAHPDLVGVKGWLTSES